VSELNKIASAYMRNWLAVRNDGAPPVVIDNRPDTSPDVPQRHDIDLVATAYVTEQTKVSALAYAPPKMASIEPLHVTIIRDESRGPRYLAGFLRNRIVWTHDFSRALRVPYGQHSQHQHAISTHEPETYVVWA
jgi:hypothetical protein